MGRIVKDFYKGDTVTVPFQIVDENEDPIDMTGKIVSLTLHLRETVEQAADDHTFTADEVDITEGQYQFAITAVESAAIDENTYYYWIRLTVDGVITTLLREQVVVYKGAD